MSIDFNGRTGNKPVRWNYYDEQPRRRLYQVYSALINLRRDYPQVFSTEDFTASVSGIVKRITLRHPDMNVNVIGNVAVTAKEAVPSFPATGWWYEYFSGDSLNVTDLGAAISLEPGEYRLYTDVRLTTPEILAGVDEVPGPLGWSEVYPNPAAQGEQIAVMFELGATTEVTARFLDLNGKLISSTQFGTLPAGRRGQTLTAPSVPGLYLLELQADGERSVSRVVVH